MQSEVYITQHAPSLAEFTPSTRATDHGQRSPTGTDRARASHRPRQTERPRRAYAPAVTRSHADRIRKAHRPRRETRKNAHRATKGTKPTNRPTDRTKAHTGRNNAPQNAHPNAPQINRLPYRITTRPNSAHFRAFPRLAHINAHPSPRTPHSAQKFAPYRHRLAPRHCKGAHPTAKRIKIAVIRLYTYTIN
jgi:hypothetical protein